MDELGHFSAALHLLLAGDLCTNCEHFQAQERLQQAICAALLHSQESFRSIGSAKRSWYNPEGKKGLAIY